MKTVLFVLLESCADWEFAPLAAVVNGAPGWRTATAAPRGKPVRSIGGFTILPDGDIPAAPPEDCAGIVLIGGLSWRSETARSVEPLARTAAGRGLPLGAICDATVFLGRSGLLNDVPHTSNMLSDLQTYAGEHYTGAGFYRSEPAVRCGGLVTANGTAPLDFAREMLIALGVLSPCEAAMWYKLFHSGFYRAPEEAAWWFGRPAAGKHGE
ncbi:MAG: glutamine amidotransferase [Lentisphaeria bacterium]|nr:glutamine amidotransferase [Lentisphaeria bacterium]